MVTEDSLTDAMREQLQTQCPLTPIQSWYPVEYNPPFLVVREDTAGCIALFERHALIKVTLFEPIITPWVVVMPEASKYIWR